jgi:hypothetical protein
MISISSLKDMQVKIVNITVTNVPSWRVEDSLNFDCKHRGHEHALLGIPSRGNESLFALCSSNILRLESLEREPGQLLAHKSGGHVDEDHAVVGLSLQKCGVFHGARRV